MSPDFKIGAKPALNPPAAAPPNGAPPQLAEQFAPAMQPAAQGHGPGNALDVSDSPHAGTLILGAHPAQAETAALPRADTLELRQDVQAALLADQAVADFVDARSEPMVLDDFRGRFRPPDELQGLIDESQARRDDLGQTIAADLRARLEGGATVQQFSDRADEIAAFLPIGDPRYRVLLDEARAGVLIEQAEYFEDGAGERASAAADAGLVLATDAYLEIRGGRERLESASAAYLRARIGTDPAAQAQAIDELRHAQAAATDTSTLADATQAAAAYQAAALAQTTAGDASAGAAFDPAAQGPVIDPLRARIHADLLTAAGEGRLDDAIDAGWADLLTATSRCAVPGSMVGGVADQLKGLADQPAFGDAIDPQVFASAIDRLVVAFNGDPQTGQAGLWQQAGRSNATFDPIDEAAAKAASSGDSAPLESVIVGQLQAVAQGLPDAAGLQRHLQMLTRYRPQLQASIDSAGHEFLVARPGRLADRVGQTYQNGGAPVAAALLADLTGGVDTDPWTAKRIVELAGPTVDRISADLRHAVARLST